MTDWGWWQQVWMLDAICLVAAVRVCNGLIGAAIMKSDLRADWLQCGPTILHGTVSEVDPAVAASGDSGGIAASTCSSSS